jgi:formyltetrahydrofolate deformylase
MAGAKFIATITCPDTTGLVAAVSGFLRDNQCFMDESSQYGDPDTRRFFMRAVFTRAPQSPAPEELAAKFAEVAKAFQMEWAFTPAEKRPRVLIAVSKFGHCLNDLLHRWHTGQMPIDIAGVFSNHEDMRSLVEWHGIPYTHLPVTPATKPRQEAAWLKIVEDEAVDLVVLARYMQVLSPDAARRLAGRCINIHHSFLPSFMGARPYQQAYHRAGGRTRGPHAFGRRHDRHRPGPGERGSGARRALPRGTPDSPERPQDGCLPLTTPAPAGGGGHRRAPCAPAARHYNAFSRNQRPVETNDWGLLDLPCATWHIRRLGVSRRVPRCPCPARPS